MGDCPSCGAEVGDEARFCAQCGAAQVLECPGCGAENAPGNRFCPSCGTGLAGGAPAPAAAQPPPPPSVSERRLVSVRFADLVGFTSLSEHRDPEAVRELLSEYFERCRSVIERYGGTVEKFIGDAVMAVWGTPVAREDDAERAVRAALDLTAAVPALGEETGLPDLSLRAGVLTGRAAVELGAETEGMVLGDTVNTASRLQSIAAPGTVLVDDVTRRASEAAVAYEDAGSHQVKGRQQPVHAWRALRVVSRVGGARRGSGPEAPLVGREEERRLIIEAFDATLAGGSARLIWVIGEAGLGKSRLAWELEKHADGVSDGVLWHRGRSLSYGDGVAFWALAEMIRARAGIGEEEESAAAAEKLHATVERYVADPVERRLVEPRLAALLGFERRANAEQADLFSGWRLFLERLADQAPVVMIFEDVQWADTGLLEFIDYLLEWSANRPIFIVALTRSELAPGADLGSDQTTAVHLQPLPDEAMDELLAALVPGAPPELRVRIAARAEGVPLYATEIVRMLVDQGVLVQHDQRYQLTGELLDLEIPETLHALIAARLDGLPGRERRLLQDASVLGLRFSEAGLMEVSDMSRPDLRAGLASLAERQLITLDTDPRSPERGQYGFGQALVRRVSYETLGRRERKQRHLRAAEHLASAWGSEVDEIADVRAAHLLDAVNAEPEAGDAPEITARARETLVAAAERASGLGAAARAAGLFAQAATLARNVTERAEMLDLAMQATLRAGDPELASTYGEQAILLWTEAGESRRAAVCSARLGRFLAYSSGRYSDHLPRLRTANEDLLRSGERDADLAETTMSLASTLSEAGEHDTAWPFVEQGLELAEELHLYETISWGLNLKNLILYARGRVEEARGLLMHSLLLAQEHGLANREIRAHNNLAAMLINRFRNGEALSHLEQARAVARRLGSRADEWLVEGIMAVLLFELGRWDEALEVAERLTADEVSDRYSAVEAAVGRCLVLLERGDIELAGSDMARLEQEPIEHTEFAAMKTAMRVSLLRHQGDSRAALELARSRLETETRTVLDRWVQEIRVQALEATLEVGDLSGASELVAAVRTTAAHADVPYLRVQADRFAARIAARQPGIIAAAPLFRRAAAAFRELEQPFSLAVVLLEHAEASGDPSEAAPLLEEASGTFERLGARPWLERAHAAQGSGAVV